MALRKGLDSVKGLVTSKSSKKADSSSNSADAVTSSEDGILDEDEGQKKDPQFSSLVIDTPNCKQCGVSFGTLTRRCHCRRCGLSFCDKHSKQRHPAPPFDENDDKSVWVREAHRAHLNRRSERVAQFLSGALEPYVEDTTDTLKDKSLRVGKGALLVAKVLPLPADAVKAIKAMDFVSKYGVVALGGLMLHQDVLEAIQVLVALVRDVDGLNATELAMGLYYLMAYRRGHRGDDPQAEEREHAEAGAEPVSSQLLAELQWYAAHALYFAYDNPVVEVQRQVTARHDLKLGLLMIRGTNSMADCLTDACAKPIPLQEDWQCPGIPTADPDKPYLVHEGMMKSALWLHDEVQEPLMHLAIAGYRIVVTGHSLGAGVAAFVTLLLRRTLPRVTGVGYATPTTMTLDLAMHSAAFFTTVVLGDDIVPRISVGAVQTLDTKPLWKGHLREDVTELRKRLATCWEPRYRAMATPPAAADSKDPAEGPGSAVARTESSYEPHALHLYCPGTVVHVYYVQGQFRASVVPNDFASLVVVEPSSRMVKDHSHTSYWEALRAVAEARRAAARPPAWQSFAAASACELCGASFVWRSTCKSAAQECRDKQHCRACGRVVCGPCSERRLALPQYGILRPARVCDQCFFAVPDPFQGAAPVL